MTRYKLTKANHTDQPATASSCDKNLKSVFADSDRKITVRRDGDKVVVSVPVRFYRRNGRQMILAGEDSSETVQQQSPLANTALIINLAKAWMWQNQLESGEFSSVDEIAKASNVDRTHVSRILQLTSLSPTIVEQIMAGNEPDGLSLRELRKGIPSSWQEQDSVLHSPQ